MKVCLHLCGYNGTTTYDKDNLQLGSDWKWHIFSFQNNLQLLFGISLEEIQFIRNKLLRCILLALTNESTQQELYTVMCYSAGIAAYRRRISLFVVQITCTLIWTKRI